MLNLKNIHHVAVICSDYARSKDFYTRILGLEILAEAYREARDSHKLDLGLNGQYVIELFSFPEPPRRITRPEATGLRHLAFGVDELRSCLARLRDEGVAVEPVRVDEYTGKRFTFLSDPDGLPIELYED